MWKYQNTYECIKAILSYQGQRSILLNLKFVQSKKYPWSAGLNFVDLGGKIVFLLYKIICKDNNIPV
jgi:hypothetical protein